MKMNKTHALMVSVLCLALTGCFESRKNTEQLCNDTPALQCERLNMDDGQCRVPRTDLIWHRFDALKNPSPKNQIKEYDLLGKYKKCLELAAQIQAIDQTELKERRVHSMLFATEDMEKIINNLIKSKSPEALYFLWSRTGNEEAKRSFLQLEGKPILETAEMQYALATFYTSRDKEKTHDLLIRSLELTKNNKVNNEVLKSLASTTYQLKRKEEAYIWAMVAKEYGVPIASESELQLLYGFDEKKYQQLEDNAAKIIGAIKNGTFSKELVPKY